MLQRVQNYRFLSGLSAKLKRKYYFFLPNDNQGYARSLLLFVHWKILL